MKDKKNFLDDSDLRHEAENLLKMKITESVSVFSEADNLKLLHELEVHQIELELQNEELMLAKKQAEAATEKYIELYDFAPTGYFSLTMDCRIAELNLIGSQMLGKERFSLINNNFEIFVSTDTLQAFTLFLEEAFQGGGIKTCNITLTGSNSECVYVYLKGIISEDREHCLVVAVDMSRQRQMEDELRKLSIATEQSPASILIAAVDGTIEYVNPKFVNLTGYSREEVIGHNIRIFKHGNTQDTDYIDLCEKIPEAEVIRNVKQNKRKNGELYWESEIIAPIINDNNKITNFIVINEDITNSKLADDKIKNLLKEKELILKEVHHRIKNNMNTVNGLLSLQAESEKNPVVVNSLNDAKNRVQSMMVLYDKLYRSDSSTDISIKEYLTALAAQIIDNFPNKSIIKTDLFIEDFVLNVKFLVPLGIIINELLTNMMKYAFAGRGTGIITLSITKEGNHVIITAQDDGTGIPELITFENSSGFGLTLISMLTDQINGSIRIERGTGTKFILEFDI